MQNKEIQGRKVVSHVLNREAKWGIFVLNGAGFGRPPRHSSTPTFLSAQLACEQALHLGDITARSHTRLASLAQIGQLARRLLPNRGSNILVSTPL